MRMGCAVQPVSPDTIDDCAAVYIAAYGEAPWNESLDPDSVRRYIRAFMDRDGFRAWQLTIEGEIAGVALGIIVPYTEGAFLRIEDLCIAPKRQRQGFGGAFLREIQRQSAALGCDSMLLATQPDVPAHGFYLKQGFRDIPTAYMYYDCRRHPSEAGAVLQIFDLNRPRSALQTEKPPAFHLVDPRDPASRRSANRAQFMEYESGELSP